METENNHENRDELWPHIEALLSRKCDTHDEIDDILRSFLAEIEAQNVHTDEECSSHCAYLLYTSSLFAEHGTYVRQQLTHVLLQDDTPCTLRITTTFLLADARENEHLFDLFNKEGCFPRLVELISRPYLRQSEQHIHRQLMELLYEMSRIQRITNNDLMRVDDDFIRSLFEIIEQVSNDVDDPYHYPVIRVLLVLNEQFMVAAHDPASTSSGVAPLTNKVIKVLSTCGHEFKTFGANLILLLNREDETSLQLLTLKLMYLLFTTPSTYEYFYLNDLRVLVDILIRNLLDLPDYAAALRHTYLRVLYPLLQHTQLQYAPYYKRDEIRKLLSMLCGENVYHENGHMHWNHFEDVDETTKRLVKRCQTVSWLYDPRDGLIRVESPTDQRSSISSLQVSPPRSKPPVLPPPRKLRKRDSSKSSASTVDGFLTPNMETARQSSLSMMVMAEQKEKPGVITPSRNPSLKQSLRKSIFSKSDKPEKPPPPKARRSGLTRPKPEYTTTEMEVVKVRLPERTDTPESQHTEATDRFEDAQEFQTESDGASRSSTQVVADIQQSNTGLLVHSQVTEPSPNSIPSDPPLQDSLSSTTSTIPSNVSTASSGKKPPPAPKARRGWRMRSRTTEEKAPAKLGIRLPSIATNVSSPDLSSMTQSPDQIHHSDSPTAAQNPFSPGIEKTLDPAASINLESGHKNTASTQTDERKDVREALAQAQARAVAEVEMMVQEAHLHDQPAPILLSSQSYAEIGDINNPSSLPSSQLVPERTIILAPPSNVARGIPGPRIELEKSPFLSDDDDEEELEEEHDEDELND